MLDDDHETWLLNEGHQIIEQINAKGYSCLTPRSRLIYCLWAADYGMRNAGDLATAADLHATFLAEGQSAAQELGLPQARAAFSLASEELERQYFSLFDNVVAEIRAV
ncbi:hypothetical protein [Rhizobium sp. MHM7A]|uniref:hypothetical protein n=1 Tax=Rhizobium sp. MHM7A TaxID=2583233 RepID=UPI00110605BA|nr:hypothetical protein [Rhizobium sp. MHM7A]TLX12078.1 hypothetical protein FFR93_16025 [Rhizobium sp. MHM7A]